MTTDALDRLRVTCLISAIPVCLSILACSLVGPDGDLSIETDRTTYRLDYRPGMYSVEMTVEIVNTRDRTLFPHRQGWDPVDPLPWEGTISNVFTVLPPTD